MKDRSWRVGAFQPKIDDAEVQAAIMDLLMERGSLTTEQAVKDFKKRWGATPIMHALRHLREAGYIHRPSNRSPWSLKPRK